MPVLACQAFETGANPLPSPRVSRKNLVETFSRAYAAASPEEQAALRVWMRDIVLPRREGRNDLVKVAEKREGQCRCT